MAKQQNAKNGQQVMGNCIRFVGGVVPDGSYNRRKVAKEGLGCEVMVQSASWPEKHGREASSKCLPEEEVEEEAGDSR